MTLFEYLAIAFSIAFSLTAARLAGGIASAARAERRSPAHLLNTCGILITTVGIFWLFWGYRDVSWTFPRFALALSNPGLLYVIACTLIPENPEQVASWHEHFRAVRRRYAILLACWISVAIAMTTWILGLPLLHPARAVQAVVLLLAFTGAVSTRDRVHDVLAVAVIGLACASFAVLILPE